MQEFLTRVASLLERYLLIWLCAASFLALKWPGSILADPFLATQTWLPYGFAVTMFAIGWLLPRKEVEQVFRRWPLVLCGTTLQYLSMPVIAFAIAQAVPLDQELRWGIIMAGCVPGAMASNVLTMVARGNVSYSLCLTTAATLVSPICVPLALKLAMNESFSMPFLPLMWRLSWMVVLPVITGFTCGLLADRIDGRSRGWATPIGKIVANVAILWIISVVVGTNRDRILQIDSSLILAIFALNLSGYGVGQLGGWVFRLPQPMGRALTLEIGMQNAGLGVTLASTIFGPDSRVLIPTALYTFGCMFTGTVLARWWATRSIEAASSSDPTVHTAIAQGTTRSNEQKE